jgi:hypothetical protein
LELGFANKDKVGILDDYVLKMWESFVGGSFATVAKEIAINIANE